MPSILRTLLLALSLGATLASPPTARASDGAAEAESVAAALRLARQGEHVRAAELLERVGTPAALYYAGWMRAQAGDWRAAAARWTELPTDSEWARKASADGTAHLLEVALRLYRAGDSDGAIEAAGLAGRLGAGEEARELARLARERRDAAESSGEDSGSSGWVATGIGYNSNLFGDGHSEVPLGSGFADLDAFVRGSPARRIFVELSGRWQEFFRSSSSRYAALELRAGGQLRVGAFDAEIGAGADYQNLGAQADAVSPGAFVRLSRGFGSNLLELDYELTRPVVAHSEFERFHAAQHALSASLTALGPGWAPSFELVLRRRGGSDIEESAYQLPLAHVAAGAAAGAATRVGRSGSFAARLGVEYRHYDRKAYPGGIERRDWTYSLALSARHGISGSLSGFVSGNSEVNRSTLDADDVDDRNSFAAVLSGGLEWRI